MKKQSCEEERERMNETRISGKLIACFPLLRNGQTMRPKILYCCMRIRCRGKVFTEKLPSNGRGIHIETQTD
jgi:hypothetical protein